MNGKAPFLIGLFLICMCGMMLQIIESRILSVISYYYLAFFAISMAMFGMTAGSLFVYFRQHLFPSERLLENLTWICAAFAIAIAVSTLLIISTVLTRVLGRIDLLTTALLWLKLVAILATPYFFAGMAISLALTRSPWPVSLVYGIDLIGAAAGCLVVLVILTIMDAVSALLLVAAFAALGATFFALARGAQSDAGLPRVLIHRTRLWARPRVLAVAFAVVAVGNAAIQPYGLKPSMVKDEIDTTTFGSIIRWNSFSRVRVDRGVEAKPQMWGPSPAVPALQATERYMDIDGSAVSAMYRFDGDLSKLDFLRYDITNLAYSIRQSGRAAVIGVGGGRDLLSAELFGFRDVTGVELNSIFIDLLTRDLRDYNRLADLPGVRLIADEGRSWFARSDEHFNLIQMSMVDTWAATGVGAFSLSENGLYTVEGWRAFFQHLTPTGVFTVSRWYSPSNLDETGRMVSVAVAALLEEGIADPRGHLFLAATNDLATLILSRSPLDTEELATLTETADRLGFSVLTRPHAPITSPLLEEILTAQTREALTRLPAAYHLDVSPAYDDRPFFFQELEMTDPVAWRNAINAQDGVARGNLQAALTLAMIIVLSVVLVFVVLLVPALPSVRQAAARIAALGSAYFLLIGLGFMFVEIGLIQRISVYLGHPVYGLSIGLFGIVVSTGVGSLLSSRVSVLSESRLLLWSIILGAYLALLPVWLSLLIDHFASAMLPIRAAVSLLAIAPPGVLMGFGFPMGMQIVNGIDARPTPWFWGINGAAGVLAAGVAVAISISFSISTTLWCGAVCYLVLGPVAVMLARRSVIREPAISVA
jgi:hypothetical protein